MEINLIQKKKQLAIQILTQIFNLNDTEKTIISQQIDFLINYNKIKKIKMLKNAKIFYQLYQ